MTGLSLSIVRLHRRWASSVIVNGVTVGPKGDYDDTNLGDGAIGLARFTLHKEACNPPSGTDGTAAPANNRIELVHYGPTLLYPNVTTISHVEIARRAYGTANTFTSVTTHYEVDTGATSGRVLAIKPKAGYAWDSGWDYRITHSPPAGGSVPIFGYLKCDQVAGNPVLLSNTDPDGAYVYSFSRHNP
jgi:hypothetical protein